VLGAQMPRSDAVRPGAVIGCREKRDKKDALYNIASTTSTRTGRTARQAAGQYFSHGLGHFDRG